MSPGGLSTPTPSRSHLGGLLDGQLGSPGPQPPPGCGDSSAGSPAPPRAGEETRPDYHAAASPASLPAFLPACDPQVTGPQASVAGTMDGRWPPVCPPPRRRPPGGFSPSRPFSQPDATGRVSWKQLCSVRSLPPRPIPARCGVHPVTLALGRLTSQGHRELRIHSLGHTASSRPA